MHHARTVPSPSLYRHPTSSYRHSPSAYRYETCPATLGKFYHVSGPHTGTTNDRTAVKYDQFIMDIHEGDKYNEVTWNYYDNDGNLQQEKGCWILCDGGYQKWRCAPRVLSVGCG